MTLSVMDDFEFNTRYECSKCNKLEEDQKTLKSENTDLRNLVSVMKTQTAKTATILQKFKTSEKTMLLQKQKLDAAERQNAMLKAEARTVNEQLKKQLDLKESSMKQEEKDKLINSMKSQQTVIDQYQAHFKELEDKLKKQTDGKKEAEKKCKDLQAKITSMKQTKQYKPELEELVSKLRTEIYALRADNKRLRVWQQEAVQKQRQEKEYNEMNTTTSTINNNHTNLESTIERTIERTIQKNLQGFLETVTSPVKASSSGIFRTPANKRGRPLGWRKKRVSAVTDDDDSDFELLTRPSKTVKRSVKRKLSINTKNHSKRKPLQQGNGNLSNSSDSDNDNDLVGQLENSFNVQSESREEPDGVLVCDPLPSSSTQFSIFEKPATIKITAPQNPPKAVMKLPIVQKAESIFNVMVVPTLLSPLKSMVEDEITARDVKDEGSAGDISVNLTPVAAVSTVDSPQPSSDVVLLQTTPKKELDRNNDPVFPEHRTEFEPISIKNEITKTKSEPDAPVFTLKPAPSKATRATPILSTLGDLLSPSKIETPMESPTTSEIEIVSVVTVEREDATVSATDCDSQIEDDETSRVSVTKLSPISDRKAEIDEVVKTTSNHQQPISTPPKPKMKLPPMSLSFVKPKNISPILADPLDVIPSSTSVNKESKLGFVRKDVLPNNISKENCIDIVPKENGIDEKPKENGIASPQSIKEEISPKTDSLPAPIILQSSELAAESSQANVQPSNQNIVAQEELNNVVVSEESMVCAFEVRLGCISSSDVETRSETTIDGMPDSEQYETPSTLSEKSDEEAFIPPRITRSRKSLSQEEEEPVVITRSLRSRKISFTETSSKRRRLSRNSASASDSNESSAPRRSRRIQSSASPSKSSSPKTKKPPTKKTCVKKTQREEVSAIVTLGSEDRNVIAPSDLAALKLSVEKVIEDESTNSVVDTPAPSSSSSDKQSSKKGNTLNSKWGMFAKTTDSKVSIEDLKASLSNSAADDLKASLSNSAADDLKASLSNSPADDLKVSLSSSATEDLNVSQSCAAAEDLKVSQSNSAADYLKASLSNSAADDLKASLSNSTSTETIHQQVGEDAIAQGRKRKKTTPPTHQISLNQIFDLLVPLEPVSPLVPCLSEPEKTKEEEVPIFHDSYEDYRNVSRNATPHFVRMFRQNLCTSEPNIPYIVETIILNHKNKALQTIEEKIIRVIRNEISIINTSPAHVPIPPIDVLVDFFQDLFTRLTNSDYQYFDESWMTSFLKKLFSQISALKHNGSDQFKSLVSFAAKFSLKNNDTRFLRAYIINSICRLDFNSATRLLKDCFSSHDIFLLIGDEQLSKSLDKLTSTGSVYLAGLEFYLRYTQLKFAPIEKLAYIHQFAVENQLIGAALDAIVLKEELGTDFQNLNDQGLVCVRLMVRSQGWKWFTSTLLPMILDKLSTTSEFGTCRLLELVVNLITAEISSFKVDADLPSIKDKLIPTLIGLLWTAPTPCIKFSIAKCLIWMSPVDSINVTQSLTNWINAIPKTLKDHELFSEVDDMLVESKKRFDGHVKRGNGFSK